MKDRHYPQSAIEMAVDIDAWVEAERRAGEYTPDFWDELNTSERLAEYMQKLGYIKLTAQGKGD